MEDAHPRIPKHFLLDGYYVYIYIYAYRYFYIHRKKEGKAEGKRSNQMVAKWLNRSAFGWSIVLTLVSLVC